MRKSCFPYTGEYCWQAARPGDSYIVDGGLHFRSWKDAIDYALGYWENQEYWGENLSGISISPPAAT